jgi:hypothetical protein
LKKKLGLGKVKHQSISRSIVLPTYYLPVFATYLSAHQPVTWQFATLLGPFKMYKMDPTKFPEK